MEGNFIYLTNAAIEWWFTDLFYPKDKTNISVIVPIPSVDISALMYHTLLKIIVTKNVLKRKTIGCITKGEQSIKNLQ